MDSAPTVLVDSSDAAVTVVTLNRPARRNALTVELMDRVREAVVAAAGDASRRAIVLRGAGTVFCAGLDFNEAADAAVAHRSAESLAALYRAIWTSPLITIAAAHGAALGGGAGLVAACDFAVAADDLRLGYPEVHRGLVAALVTCLLRRQLPGRKLRETVLMGQTLDAVEAERAGLVNRVVPAGSLNERAMELARDAIKGAPGAIARTKSLLDRLHPIDDDIRIALSVHVEARNAPEAWEGIKAFLEKRPPRWPPREV